MQVGATKSGKSFIAVGIDEGRMLSIVNFDTISGEVKIIASFEGASNLCAAFCQGTFARILNGIIIIIIILYWNLKRYTLFSI